MLVENTKTHALSILVRFGIKFLEIACGFNVESPREMIINSEMF